MNNCKFPIISNLCLIVDLCICPSRALTRSLEASTPFDLDAFLLEFSEEVDIRENQHYDSEEEMTSETDDDESETNNANVNNYLDSANMASNLEKAMKIAEEEDLWIGDSGASSHMMGSEEHVFNKKLISGSMRTANGAHMKMLCEGDINVDVITKNGDVTSGTLRVKVIPGMKQNLFSFTQAMLGGWTM